MSDNPTVDLKKIMEAKEKNFTKLDLSRTQLGCLPPEIEKLKKSIKISVKKIEEF